MIYLGIIIVGILGIASYIYMDKSKNIPANKDYKKLYEQLSNNESLEKATLAGGCFWCMEGPFEQLEGVIEVFAGFSGGKIPNPSYEQVVSGQTSHRESVQIFYDPTKVKYEDIIQQYWWQIDPTDPGGQFSDRGNHYTTAIFYHNDVQKTAAENSKSKLESSGMYENDIVTQIIPYSNFYLADNYHQDFYINSSTRYKLYEQGSGRKSYKEQIQEKLKSLTQ